MSSQWAQTAAATWLFSGLAISFIAMTQMRNGEPPRWCTSVFTWWFVSGIAACFVFALYTIWGPQGSLISR